MTNRKTNTEMWDSFALDLVSIQVEGKIVYINTAGAKMLGATAPEQLIGKPILDFVHPSYQEIVSERIRQMITDGIVVCLSEEKWLRLDGTVIAVEVAAMPLAYEGRPAVQFIARHASVSESRRLMHKCGATIRPRGNHPRRKR